MAILTWRNVDAPNLAGAALAVGEAGRNFSGAFSDLATGLGQFGQAQTDRADAAAIQAASRITDSDAYAQALQSGSILSGAGIDPTRVSAKVSQALADRQKDLLAADFDKAQIANQEQDNALALRKFEAEQAQAVLDNQIRQYGFGRTQQADQRADQEYADQTAARDAAFQAVQQGLTPAGAREYINGLGLSPRAQQMALGSLKLGGSLLNIPTAAPGSAGAGRTGADAWYSSTSDTPYLAPDRPLSQGTFGEAHDFGQRLIPATRGQVGAGPDKGTSAVGAFQMIGSTMEKYASQVLGENWRDQPFTFSNQAKVAEAIFNDSKDGNLKAVWAGLPDATPGAYKNMSWEEFQREVLPRESGITYDEAIANEAAQRGQATLAAGETILEGMEGNAAQRLGSIDLGKYAKDSQNTDPDPTRAAERAIKSYPSLKGTDLNKVAGWISEIQQAAEAKGTPITAAQATHILGASMSPSGLFDFSPIDGAESGLFFDEDKMADVLSAVTSGDNIGRGAVQRQIAADVDAYKAAAGQVTAAQKNMQLIRDREAQGLEVKPSDKSAATKALNKALDKHEALSSRFSSQAYQQKLSKSNAEVADSRKQAQEKAAATLRPVATGTPAGLAYSPATALTTGLPNRAAELLRERSGQ